MKNVRRDLAKESPGIHEKKTKEAFDEPQSERADVHHVSLCSRSRMGQRMKTTMQDQPEVLEGKIVHLNGATLDAIKARP